MAKLNHREPAFAIFSSICAAIEAERWAVSTE